MHKRLVKILAERGICSRRKAEQWIFEGKVAVEGQIIKTPQTLIDPKIKKIVVNGILLPEMEKKMYFLLNKPKGYLCSNRRPHPNSKIVIDLFKEQKQRLFTVGRLDKETTGLLIVTNDGDFANQVIHPSSEISKEYLAYTVEQIQHSHLKLLSSGMSIDKITIIPHKIKKVGKNKIKITVGEGKKRQVRRLLEYVGLTVKELVRIRIGPLHLGNLQLGAYRPLREKEIEIFVSKS